MAAIRRALISVSDKTGILDLARALAARGVEILSTGGTARLLAEHRVPVTEVSEHTGFPEMMGGRQGVGFKLKCNIRQSPPSDLSNADHAAGRALILSSATGIATLGGRLWPETRPPAEFRTPH